MNTPMKPSAKPKAAAKPAAPPKVKIAAMAPPFGSSKPRKQTTASVKTDRGSFGIKG